MATPVILPGLPAGLVTVMTMLEVPPDAMVDGVKVLVTVGGIYTFKVSDAGAGLLPAEV